MGCGGGGVTKVLFLFLSELSGVIVKDTIAFSISCLFICLFIYLLCFSFFNSLHSYMDFSGDSDSEKSPTVQETWVQFLCLKDPLEKEMAAHSSILAWRI